MGVPVGGLGVLVVGTLPESCDAFLPIGMAVADGVSERSSETPTLSFPPVRLLWKSRRKRVQKRTVMAALKEIQLPIFSPLLLD